MILLADGNGPIVNEIVSPTAIPVDLSTPIASQSATLVNPTVTPVLTQGWFTGSNILWGILIIVVIGAIVYWIRRRNDKVATKRA